MKVSLNKNLGLLILLGLCADSSWAEFAPQHLSQADCDNYSGTLSVTTAKFPKGGSREVCLDNGLNVRSGPMRVFDKNGNLHMTGTYKDGLGQGTFMTFHPNGMVKTHYQLEIGSYEDGTWDAFLFTFADKFKPKGKENTRSYLVGDYFEFDDNGNLTERYNFGKNLVRQEAFEWDQLKNEIADAFGFKGWQTQYPSSTSDPWDVKLKSIQSSVLKDRINMASQDSVDNNLTDQEIPAHY